jgi:hypothetical protein
VAAKARGHCLAARIGRGTGGGQPHARRASGRGWVRQILSRFCHTDQVASSDWLVLHLVRSARPGISGWKGSDAVIRTNRQPLRGGRVA